MSSRVTTTCIAIGAALVFTAGAVSSAAAQTDTSRSTARNDTTTRTDTARSGRRGAQSAQRIRVRKETGATSTLDTSSAAGTLSTPRRDTTAAPNPTTTTDTTMAHPDTTMRPDTTTRPDTSAARTDTSARSNASTFPRADTTQPDTTRRDTIPSDTVRRDTIPPDTTRPDTVPRPDTTRPDTIPRPDTTRPDTTRPDTTRRDTVPMPPDTTRRDTTTVTTTTTSTPATTGSDTVGMTPGTGRMGHLGGGFYVGVGGGATVPTGNFNDAFKTGWNVNVPIGWQPNSSPWGLQLDLSYDRMTGRSFAFGGAPAFSLSDAAIWSGALDLTLNVPFGGRNAFYVMGGGGLHHFTDFGAAAPNGAAFTPTSSSLTKFGVNGGGGFSFGLGAASDLYIESRFVSVFTPGKNTNYVPIVLGFRFY